MYIHTFNYLTFQNLFPAFYFLQFSFKALTLRPPLIKKRLSFLPGWARRTVAPIIIIINNSFFFFSLRERSSSRGGGGGGKKKKKFFPPSFPPPPPQTFVRVPGNKPWKQETKHFKSHPHPIHIYHLSAF